MRWTICFAGVGVTLLLGALVSWSDAPPPESERQEVALAPRNVDRINRVFANLAAGQYSGTPQNSLACPLNDVQDPKELKPGFTACGEVLDDWQVFCCVQDATNTYDGTTSYDNRPNWKSAFAVPPAAVMTPTPFDFIASYVADDFSDCVEIRKNVRIDDGYATDCDCGQFAVANKQKVQLATALNGNKVKIKYITIGGDQVKVGVRVENPRAAGRRVDVQLRTWFPGQPATRVAHKKNVALLDQTTPQEIELDPLPLRSTLKPGDYIVFASAKDHKPDVRRIALNKKDIPNP